MILKGLICFIVGWCSNLRMAIAGWCSNRGGATAAWKARLQFWRPELPMVGLLLLLLLAQPPARAQSFRGGFQAGLTASEVSGDLSGGPNKLGWFASVYTDISFSPHTYWQLELMYIQKGSREFNDPETPEEGIYRDYRLNLQYVEVPVVFKFDFSVFERLPYADWLTGEIGLSVSRVVGHYETNDEGAENTDLMALERPFHAGELNVLAGFYFPVSDNLNVHFRYTQGVTPLRPHAGGTRTWYNRGQYNSVWLIGLAYLIF
jgi:hypothetical protein